MAAGGRVWGQGLACGFQGAPRRLHVHTLARMRALVCACVRVYLNSYERVCSVYPCVCVCVRARIGGSPGSHQQQRQFLTRPQGGTQWGAAQARGAITAQRREGSPPRPALDSRAGAGVRARPQAGALQRLRASAALAAAASNGSRRRLNGKVSRSRLNGKASRGQLNGKASRRRRIGGARERDAGASSPPTRCPPAQLAPSEERRRLPGAVAPAAQGARGQGVLGGVG